MLLHIILLFFISFIGFVLNVVLLVRLCTGSKKPFSSFQKLCLLKTVPNLMITSVFAFWASTISFIGKHYSDISIIQNIFVSQVVGGFSYFFAPIIQVCMSVNRFSIIFFPFSNYKRIPLTNIAILGSFLLANVPVLLSALSDCYLVFDPKTLLFLPERLEECGQVMDKSVFVTIGGLALISNGFNLAIFVKLLKDKMDGISEAKKSQRRKKWQSMYIQSVIQDLIQVIDITNYNFTSKIFDTPLWIFLCCTLSFACVYALDGFVMLYFHTNWNFCGCKKYPKKSSFFVSRVHSSAVKSKINNTNLVIPN